MAKERSVSPRKHVNGSRCMQTSEQRSNANFTEAKQNNPVLGILSFITNVSYRSKKQQTALEATIYYKYFISARRYNLSGFHSLKSYNRITVGLHK